MASSQPPFGTSWLPLVFWGKMNNRVVYDEWLYPEYGAWLVGNRVRVSVPFDKSVSDYVTVDGDTIYLSTNKIKAVAKFEKNEAEDYPGIWTLKGRLRTNHL